MKKILLLLALVLPLSLYSIDLYHNNEGDMMTLRDGKTHKVYFVPINEPDEDNTDWHYVNVEYHAETETSQWRCWNLSGGSDIKKAHELFDEIGASVDDINQKVFIDQFFFTDADFENHLYTSPQYVGFDI